MDRRTELRLTDEDGSSNKEGTKDTGTGVQKPNVQSIKVGWDCDGDQG